MIRVDLVLSRIKPVLFRDLTLHTFFWKSFKWPVVLVGKADGWSK